MGGVGSEPGPNRRRKRGLGCLSARVPVGSAPRRSPGVGWHSWDRRPSCHPGRGPRSLRFLAYWWRRYHVGTNVRVCVHLLLLQPVFGAGLMVPVEPGAGPSSLGLCRAAVGLLSPAVPAAA